MQNKLVYIFLSLFTIISTSLLFATGRIDSLISEVERMDNNTEKVSTLIEISDSLKGNATIESVKYAQKALAVAKRINHKKSIGDAFYQIAMSQYYRDDYEQAKYFCKLSIRVYKNLSLNIHLGKAYYLQGNIYAYQNDLDSAQFFLNQSLPLFKKEVSIIWQADVYASLGMIYNKRQSNDTAITYLNIAITNYSKLQPIRPQKLLRAYILKGIALNDKKEYEASIGIYQEALQLAKAIGDIYNGHICKTNLGWTYQVLDDYKKAEIYCSEALKTATKINNIYSITTCNKCLGLAQYKQGSIHRAENYLLEALQTAQEAKLKDETIEIYNHLTDIFIKQGAYKKAFEYFKASKIYSDATFQKEKAAELFKLKKEYKTSNKQLEKQLVQMQNTLSRWQWIGGFFIFSLIASVILLYITTQRIGKHYKQQLATEHEKYQSELQQVQDELEKFTYAASHDLKEPMRNIMSFAGLLQKRLDKKYQDAELTEYANFIVKGARQMYDIIIGILEFSTVNTYPTQLTEANTKAIIDSALISMEDLINEKNAVIHIDENLPECLITNEIYLRLIFKYLIENAITYNKSDEPTVEISYQRLDNHHIFKVKDNGIGIDKQYHSYIFDMFKRIHSRDEYQGTGMGLAICKKLVEALEGKIEITSELNNGAIFAITLPIL